MLLECLVVVWAFAGGAVASPGLSRGPPHVAWAEGCQPVVSTQQTREPSLRLAHMGRALAVERGVQQVATLWPGTTVMDLHNEYYNIFPSGNRNAASHLWSRFILERSAQMTRATFETMFAGFCPVSGSPVAPTKQKRYKLTLDKVDGSGLVDGMMYFCCWPCICDTKDLIKVDTMRVATQEGEGVYNFAVIGNPCLHPEKLTEQHDDPFRNGQKFSLASSAPDLRCQNGVLQKAILSDHGYVIIGLLQDIGSFTASDFITDDMSMSPRCAQRAQTGYASGMGTIFRLAAGISPVIVGQESSQPCSDPGASGRCCTGLLLETGIQKIQHDIASSKIVLYGWGGCSCTTIARSRFQEKGLCFLENVWNERDSVTMDYLKCRYGEQHHSFIWANQEFVGNGFAFAPERMTSDAYMGLLSRAGATLGMCQFKGDANLFGKPLQSCTQDGDGTTTGWTRTGSCVWDPSDAGYHQVCVTISDTFLRSSATHDANDLTSVVAAGGHWCICAWAWASAVSRDPENMEGIEIDCQRTNGRLRQVFELHILEGRNLTSPSGASYKAKAAMDALNRKCPPQVRNISVGARDASTESEISRALHGDTGVGIMLSLWLVMASSRLQW